MIAIGARFPADGADAIIAVLANRITKTRVIFLTGWAEGNSVRGVGHRRMIDTAEPKGKADDEGKKQGPPAGREYMVKVTSCDGLIACIRLRRVDDRLLDQRKEFGWFPTLQLHYLNFSCT